GVWSSNLHPSATKPEIPSTKFEFQNKFTVVERKPMPQYHIWTIGCQMNKAESERLASYLENRGYRAAPDAEYADLILVNSCVVRQSAENRVINKLQVLKTLKRCHPQTSIALTGCLVGADREKLKRSFPFVDYFFPAGDLPGWLGDHRAEEMLPQRPGAATYVPIMQGCDNFCAYCVVPYRRGRERSRPLEEIVCEVKGLANRGVKEVTLLGQNVDSYGHDLADKPDLADLLYRLDPIEGLCRIRFLTNHPKDMKSKLIDAVARLDKVCEQINLPVQAGDNAVLKAMRRGYTVEHYRELVAEIRARVPEISLSTDVIVGFPGETDEQFQNTYKLLSEIQFDVVHVAAYSPRPETLAGRVMADDVPPGIKKERLEKIEHLQAKIAGDINARLQDRVVEVLVEGKKRGKWTGRTRGDKLVFFSDKGGLQSCLVNIRITRTSPWSLSGELGLPERVI
ncbi:MAG: miaB, partial [Chloroflexi bacterium]|nr:miaB [Chloroflexota bacterium]